MTDEKIDEKIRLGGMALPNGVLVHGPKSWACAIRREDGQVEVASALKRFRAANVNQAFLRGPLRLAEAMAILPQVKRALPEAELPMQNRRVLRRDDSQRRERRRAGSGEARARASAPALDGRADA